MTRCVVDELGRRGRMVVIEYVPCVREKKEMTNVTFVQPWQITTF